MKTCTPNDIKKTVGEKAATLIEEGMAVGLGTGSTVAFFIESLAQRCRSGLNISAVASSKRSLEQAKKGGIPLLNRDKFSQLDITVDGADEIDPRNCMIKGGGGALTWEKILAASSKRLIIIADESKLVPVLGKFGVAIEILPFCYLTTVERIRKEGFDGSMRLSSEGPLFVTDNGNYIFDIHQPQTIPQPEEAHYRLAALPGVVETGFFFNLPTQFIVGYKDGTIKIS